MKEFDQCKGLTYTRNFVCNKVKNLPAESLIARHTVEDECNFYRCNNLFKANRLGLWQSFQQLSLKIW